MPVPAPDAQQEPVRAGVASTCTTCSVFSVRGRIDWKHALSLELDDAGFDFSVLSEFRRRLLAGGPAQALLETLLDRLKAQGLLQARGRQRIDSTHVLAAVRALNRIEVVGETLRHALNTLVVVAPEWVLTQLAPGWTTWVERYGGRLNTYRLPPAAGRGRSDGVR